MYIITVDGREVAGGFDCAVDAYTYYMSMCVDSGSVADVAYVEPLVQK